MLRVYGQAHRNNILLVGDACVGKSSVILEAATRLGVPVFQLACSGKTRFQHLIDSCELVNGEANLDGCTVRALNHGLNPGLNPEASCAPGEKFGPNLAPLFILWITPTWVCKLEKHNQRIWCGQHKRACDFS